MQRAEHKAITRKAFRARAKARRGASGVAENLQQQEFAPAPNRCWAGDNT
jgi:hypothetical protein